MIWTTAIQLKRFNTYISQRISLPALDISNTGLLKNSTREDVDINCIQLLFILFFNLFEIYKW